jgi:uncharacterized tellurite resistance protein B-like protein
MLGEEHDRAMPRRPRLLYTGRMLFRWIKTALAGEPETCASASDELKLLLHKTMPEASEQDATIVASLAGLLAYVAYADRKYEPAEHDAITQALARVHDLPAHAGEAVVQLLVERMAELAHESLPTYTRVLYELTSRGARLELFEVLMDVAVADHVLTMEETNALRRIANLLGLSEQDYQAAQSKYRDRLSVLR